MIFIVINHYSIIKYISYHSLQSFVNQILLKFTVNILLNSTHTQYIQKREFYSLKIMIIIYMFT